MSGPHSYQPRTAFERWLEARLPIISFVSNHVMEFPTPKNLNYWWTFGGILAFCLATQIITGIVLAMHYVASGDGAFASVQHIMRDVDYGWLIRYIHSNGASMFFVAVYIHIFRGIYYGSYKAPREVLWLIGCAIYVVMMATAFFGYVLPWGQMSFWAAKVITSLFGAIPVIGPPITTWLWGGYSVDAPTLNRFYSLHYLLPFIIAALVVLHIWALHVPGNNNPTGVDVKSKSDTVPFHPYYTVKDSFGVSLFVIMFAVFVFYLPELLSHVDNNIPANPLATPAHIVPEWYFLPYYAILRAIPDKLTGVIALGMALVSLFALPWLDRSHVRSMRYRPQAKIAFFIFIVDVLILGLCGAHEPDEALFPGLGSLQFVDGDLNSYLWLSRLGAIYYFVYFWFLAWFIPMRETPLKAPESISTPVLTHPAAQAAAE